MRNALGVVTGDRIEFVMNEESGRYEIIAATQSISALKGIIGTLQRPVSVVEMHATIAERGASAR
ncbi:hypothetical protein CS8_021690 [Cupriavidus sp. 8B]